MSPILFVHICGGAVGLVSGATAMSLRKGTRRHGMAGKVFVFSMLVMAAGAICLAIQNHEPPNIMGGMVTFYMVLTAWLTARRGDGTTSKFDRVALLFPLAFGVFMWFSGIQKLRSPALSNDGVPFGMNFFLGSVMLLAAAGDVRMLHRGGLAGRARIARHLWRMCFGLFIATGSFFLGPANRPLRFLSALGLRQHFFKVILREAVLVFLAVLPLLLLIFWLVRIRFAKAYPGSRSQTGSHRRRAAVYGRVGVPASLTRP